MKYLRTHRQVTCPVCGNASAEVLYEITSADAAQWFFLREADQERYSRIHAAINRLWTDGRACFVQCTECSFCFSDPYIAGGSEFYGTLYETPRYPDWKWEFEMSYASLQAKIRTGELNNPHLLEIGAGDGAFVRRVAGGLLPADHILTLEYSDYGRRRIEESGIACLPKDVRELDVQQYGGRFDVVCMFQVLEHLDRLDELFGCLNSITSSNAVLYIAVPNDRRVEFNEEHEALGDMAPCHVGRWNEKSFQMIARRFGWQVDAHRREPESLLWRFLEFALYRYVQQTKRPGSLYNKVEVIHNRLLRYMGQIPLISLMALRSLPLVPQLLRADLGKAQWVELRRQS